MEKLSTAFSTSLKQIKRSGWLAWASIAVMTLAILVTSIFGFLAYVATLFLQNLEQKPQIYVVFEVGTPEEKIFELRNQFEQIQGIAYTEYTSEEQARDEFSRSQRQVNELAARAVEERRLPATLAVRLDTLTFAETVNEDLLAAKEKNAEINDILYSRDVVDNIREVFGWLRIGGGVIMAMLLIVIVLFTLLTVEFRMHSRSEEIEIMQLVGGSLGYIRMPFIFEGAIYGSLGALISNGIIAVLLVFIYNQWTSGKLNYIRGLLSSLEWPSLSVGTFAISFFIVLLIGTLVGGINSYIAIRRYIK